MSSKVLELFKILLSKMQVLVEFKNDAYVKNMVRRISIAEWLVEKVLRACGVHSKA